MMQFLKVGHPERAALDKLQAEIPTVQAGIKAIETMHLHIDEVRARIAAQVKNAVDSSRPQSLFNSFVSQDLTYAPHWRSQAMSAADHIAMAAYLDGEDQVVNRIMGRLKAEEKFGALGAAERAVKLRKHRADLEALELAEEREIRRLERAGRNVIRRGDAREDILFRVWAEEDSKVAA